MIQQIDTLLTLTIGGTVLCPDGHGGHVRKVVLDPVSKGIVAIVVDRGLTHNSVVVPINLVRHGEREQIVLTIDTEELAGLHRFAEIDFSEPDPAWASRFGHAASEPQYNVLRDAVPFGVAYPQRFNTGLVQHHVHDGITDQLTPIGRSTKVSSASGHVGHVEQVIVDPEGHMLLALIVHMGHLHSRLVRVPVEWVGWISEAEIHLSIDQSVAKDLPDYQPGDI